MLHVLDALAEIDVSQVVMVVGHRASWVTKALSEHSPTNLAIEYVEQLTQRGTGDATAVALTGIPDDGVEDIDVVVLPGDTPLLRPATLAALVRHHRAEDAAATVLTAKVDEAGGYGRIVRGPDGAVVRVVEQADAGAEELAIKEINTSVYCFRRGLLAPSLRRLRPTNAQGEYYLTDVIEVLHAAGHRVSALIVDDPMEVAGVNDRAQLASADAVLRDRINERWMRRGVTMWDPENTYIDAETELARDVTLLPGVVLRGACQVEQGAEIGPASTLIDTKVGAGAEIHNSVCTRAEVGAGARIGPFSVLGPGASVGERAIVPSFHVVPDMSGESLSGE